MKFKPKRESMEILVIIALLLIAFAFIRPQMTGMVVGEVNHTTLHVNKVFNESTELDLSLEGNLTSLAVSGSYSGEKVEIYLDELLVYSSENGMNQITGHVNGNNPAKETNITNQTQSNITNLSVNQTNTTEQVINQSVNESGENTEDTSIKQFLKFSNECEDTCVLENYPRNITLTIVLDNATLNLTSITYSYLKPESTEKQNITNVTNNISKEINYTRFDNSEVRVGEPVTWTKRIDDVSSVTIPASAYDIQTDNEVKVISGNQKLSLEEFSQLKAGKRGDIRLEVKNNTQITFKTPGPEKKEKEIDEYRKQVTISSDIHYRDVLASTNIPESAKASINVYWLKDGKKERVDDIAYFDNNNNGLIDEIEWTVPHLSNQTYEISITILNPYTYLRDGETWTVAFNTTGMANLTITSPNAGWTEFLSDNEETFDEMEFLDVKCGEESLKDELKLIDFNGNKFDYSEVESANSLEIEKLLVEDYSCDNTGYLSNYMHKAGYATLKFEYANQENSVTDFAYDPENYTYTFGGVTQSTDNHFAYETYGESSFPNPGNQDSSFSCGDNLTYSAEEYRTVLIGSQCWLADNLNVVNGSTDKDCSFARYCYDSNEANCDNWGGLYYWDDMMCGESANNLNPSPAQGICPNGWHIPSYKEIRVLEQQVCSDIGNSNCDTTFPINSITSDCRGQDTTTGEGEGSALAGVCNTWLSSDITNSGACNNDFGTSGLDVLGRTHPSFEGQIGRFWTATTEDADTDEAWVLDLYSWNSNACTYDYDYDNTPYPVRCVRDNFTEATNSDYSNIASSDNNRWITTGANQTGEYDSQMFKFFINESEENVSQIDFLWEGYGENNSGFNTSMYAWDYDTGDWVMLDTYDFQSGADNTLTHSEVGTTERFIDSDGEITLLVKTKKYYFSVCNDTLWYGGDNYSTISIGDQCWMADNLRISDGNEDQSCSFTRYCLGDDSDNCTLWGGFYIWEEMMCGESASTSEPSGVQGICPNDWHIPSLYEFITMERQICSDIGNTNCDTTFPKVLVSDWYGEETFDGEGEGSSMAGYCDLWDDNNIDNSGSCNNDFGTSGLKLPPSGIYDYDPGISTWLWTTTTENASSNCAWTPRLHYMHTDIHHSSHIEKDSEKLSVRCVKDSSSPYFYIRLNGRYLKAGDFVGGATSPEKEYLDFKDISHTVIEDGLVKLKISEELNETSFIDRIYLLVDGDEIIELSNINGANKSLLSESDDKYLIMQLGDEYYLEFEAPENYTKLEFAAEGYYIEHYKKAEIKHNSLYTDFVQIKTYINEPPTIDTPTITPVLAHKTDDLDCNATPIDRTNTTLDVEYIWYNCTERPCTFHSGGNRTGLTNGTNYVINTFSSSNTHVGEVWNCSVRSYDGIKYSDAATSLKLIYGIVNGTIKDSESDPVENAEIEVDLHQSDYQVNTTSDATGYWSVDVNQTGYYKVTGYLPTNSSMGGDIEVFVEVTP